MYAAYNLWGDLLASSPYKFQVIAIMEDAGYYPRRIHPLQTYPMTYTAYDHLGNIICEGESYNEVVRACRDLGYYLTEFTVKES